MRILNVVKSLACFAAALSLSLTANAACPSFNFDFETGLTTPWLSAGNTGPGSVGVVLHNSSQMATAQASLGGWRSLSYDFSYCGNDTLSFDMRAFSTGYQSGAGVQINFTNQFNVALGSVSFYNLTDPAQLPPNGFAIDSVQHNYSGSQATFATLAGLTPADPISKISLTFIAWTPGFASTGAQVWFDNVTNVPEPTQLLLMALGLAFVMLVTSRKHAFTPES